MTIIKATESLLNFFNQIWCKKTHKVCSEIGSQNVQNNWYTFEVKMLMKIEEFIGNVGKSLNCISEMIGFIVQ